MAECGKRAESATDDNERGAILREGVSYLATEAITCFAFAVALGQRVQEQAAMLDDLQAQLALSRPASFV